MLSCDQVARELSDAIDGETPLWTRMQMRLHLAMCRTCRRVAGSLEHTVDVLHSLRDVPPDRRGDEHDGHG